MLSVINLTSHNPKFEVLGFKDALADILFMTFTAALACLPAKNISFWEFKPFHVIRFMRHTPSSNVAVPELSYETRQTVYASDSKS